MTDVDQVAEEDDLPKVGVVFDVGAASAREINAASEGICRPVLLCDFSLPSVARQEALLRATSHVLDIQHRTPAEVGALLNSWGIRHLTTFSEPQLSRTALFAAASGIAYHSDETIRLCTDKRAQRLALGAAGVSSVRQASVSRPGELAEAVRQVGLPCVIKPASGAGSRNAYRLSTEGDLDEVLDCGLWDDDPGQVFVVESFLEGDPTVAGLDWGDYVSVEVVSHRGVHHPVCVTGKLPFAEPFRETGVVVPSTLPKRVHESCVAVALRAVDALGITRGVSHTELKLTAQGPEIIEVNARVGGYVPALLKRSTGFDLIAAELRATTELAVDVPVLRFATVEFQYFLQPPPGAGALVALEGIDKVRRLPGVLRVERGLGIGDQVDVGQGTSTFLLSVHGGAPSHPAVLDLVAQVHSVVTPAYSARSHEVEGSKAAGV